MQKLIVLALMASPCLCFAQFGFIIHKPFSGEPLFCNDVACMRKAKISKQFKKTKHAFHSKPCQGKSKDKKEEPIITPVKKYFLPNHDSIPHILPIAPSPEGIQTKDVFFPHDEYELDSTACQTLDELTRYFMQQNIKTIYIHGHTDSSGTISYNQALSQKRAECVKKYLTEKGIPSEYLHTKYFAFLSPISSNTSEKNKSLNRRVEIRWEE